jgi:hypothetical protein
MDDEQVALMREYSYDPLITADQLDPAEMATVVAKWFQDSCGLKFISAVYSDKSIGTDGFVDVVSQFEGNEDEDDEDDENV